MNEFTNYSEPQLFTKENEGIRTKFVANVFAWMFGALIITGVVAYLFGSSPALMQLLLTETGISTVGWIVMLAPFGLVLLMSFAVEKLPTNALIGIFLLYSVLMGASLGFIFLTFQINTIFLAFFISAGMFALMAIAGYTTKVDLTKFGSILMIALVAVVIGSVVNMFLKNDSLDFIICILGVLVFTGLIAYEMQKIKKNEQYAMANPEAGRKMAIMSALSLYLSFINLFLLILRLLSRRD